MPKKTTPINSTPITVDAAAPKRAYRKTATKTALRSEQLGVRIRPAIGKEIARLAKKNGLTRSAQAANLLDQALRG